MAADFDAVGARLPIDLHLQNAPAARRCSLLAMKASTSRVRDQLMLHCVRRQRPGRTACSRVFRHAEFRRELPRDYYLEITLPTWGLSKCRVVLSQL